jgi:Transposase zinc-ribbon domain
MSKLKETSGDWGIATIYHVDWVEPDCAIWANRTSQFSGMVENQYISKINTVTREAIIERKKPRNDHNLFVKMASNPRKNHIPLQVGQVHEMFWTCGSPQGSVAPADQSRSEGESVAGLREFIVEFGGEEQCIQHLAGLRWPGGFACAGCGGRQAWRLKTRPRVYECATCHRQESVTAGTVFHRTRTDLNKWFLAAYLMGRDKRGVSAKFCSANSVWRIRRPGPWRTSCATG